MTPDQITARNRANAQKSTGPRTVRGKAIVSQNAHRHGATSKPDPTSVAAWLRIILDAPDLEPGEVLKDGRRTPGALALAEAEVRVCSTRAALEEFERGDAPRSDFVQHLQNDANLISEALKEGSTSAKRYRSGLALLRRIEKLTEADTALGGKRHRLLKRYAREARGHHKRAFRSWLVCLHQTGVLAEEST